MGVNDLKMKRKGLILNTDKTVKFLTECILSVFTTLYQTKLSQSGVRICCGWLLRLREKAKIYQRYDKHGRSVADYKILRDISSRCKNSIKEAKSNYFFRLEESLNEPAITPKKYWSILNCFLHKRKISKIPPIRLNNTFLTDT